MKESVDIPKQDRISVDDFLLVDDCILNDYPELWYYQCRYWHADDLVSKVKISDENLKIEEI